MVGTFTHLASSEVLTDTELGHQTRQQLDRFHFTLDRLRKLGADPGITHIANSAAIAARPETWADMVRPGALLYGYHPGFDPPGTPRGIRKKVTAAPGDESARPPDQCSLHRRRRSVGYDATWIAQRPSRIAVLSAGYADGVHRSLGNRGVVYIRGHVAPILGIVSMDVIMLDVTDVPDAAIGDIATLYGTEGDRTYPANVVARSIGTVTSDLISGVGQRVPRIYVP